VLKKLVTHILKIHFNVKIRLLTTGEALVSWNLAIANLRARFLKKCIIRNDEKVESRMKVMILTRF